MEFTEMNCTNCNSKTKTIETKQYLKPSLGCTPRQLKVLKKTEGAHKKT
jgi:hypothetical protein